MLDGWRELHYIYIVAERVSAAQPSLSRLPPSDAPRRAGLSATCLVGNSTQCSSSSSPPNGLCAGQTARQAS